MVHCRGIGAGLLQAGKGLSGRTLQKIGRFQSCLISLLLHREGIYKQIPIRPPLTTP